MLEITVPPIELYDESKDEFIELEEQTLKLEHSLVALSTWESKWHKPFLHTKNKTQEETIDYIRCMTLNENVNPLTYNYLSRSNIDEINKYTDNPMTATTFRDDKKRKSSREIVTAEIIYHWMISFNIPVEFQHWHINRLITLVRVREIKSNPPKKRSMRDSMSQNTARNAANRKRFGSKG